MSVEVASAVDSLHGFQVSTYLHVAGTALLVFDWFLTLDAEVKHAWNVPWNLGRILFFGTRYPVFIDAMLSLYHEVGYSLSGSTCTVLIKATGYMQSLGIVWAEVILTIRIWALWGRGRKMGIFLTIVSAANGTVGIMGFAFFQPSYTFSPMDSLSPGIPGCFFSVGHTSLFWIGYAALTVHLTFIFAMTMIKGIQHYHAKTHGSSLICAFYIDGIIYYFTLQVLSIVNLVVIVSLPGPAYINLLTSIQRVFHSVLSARILLHLRQEVEAIEVRADDSEEQSRALTYKVTTTLT